MDACSLFLGHILNDVMIVFFNILSYDPSVDRDRRSEAGRMCNVSVLFSSVQIARWGLTAVLLTRQHPNWG